jgi:hypothetical protein
MKRNDYLLITATAAYSYLFYMQNAGINFLLFTLFMTGLFLLRSKELYRDKKWLWAAGISVASAVGVFIHSSTLAIIANIVSLMILSGLSFNVKTSAIFSFLFSLFSLCSSVIYVIVDAVNRSHAKPVGPVQGRKGYKIWAVIISIFICMLFFLIYKNANPLFAENMKWLNLDFLTLPWIGFTMLGFFLVYPLLYHKTIPTMEPWENQLPLENLTAAEEQAQRYEIERFGGILLFVILNLMLIILNAGDIGTIWLNRSLPAGINHSDFVHNGVGMIILSIVIATSLFMYLFRRKHTESKQLNILKLLVYAWIVQNLIMLFSTAWRNQMYIHSFNLTYKRVGVYVWLSLAVIGLVISFIKIMKEKSNWYLVKSNFFLWFTVLAASSLVNWDLLITRYNISNKSIYQVDFYYLFTLSDSNIPELIEVTKRKEFVYLNSRLKDYTPDYRYHNQDYMTHLRWKVESYLKDYNQDWRSFDLRDHRIISYLYNK